MNTNIDVKAPSPEIDANTIRYSFINAFHASLNEGFAKDISILMKHTNNTPNNNAHRCKFFLFLVLDFTLNSLLFFFLLLIAIPHREYFHHLKSVDRFSRHYDSYSHTSFSWIDPSLST